MKIVVVQPIGLLDEHKSRLEKLGEVTYHQYRTKNVEEWLERTKGFDVVCSGVFGISSEWRKLKNVFVSLPFVNVGWADPALLKLNNVTISNSPGCNKHAVCEWIIGMLILMARDINTYLNIEELPFSKMPPMSKGLSGKNITILGHGNIGKSVGGVANALGMKATFFKRGDDLLNSVRDADFVVDALSSKPETQDLLNKKFFDSLKGGVYFATVSAGKVLDVDAMFEALDTGKLKLAAHDAFLAGDTSDDLYQKILKHPKVFATPHIAYNTDEAEKTGCDMMIDNIEAWLKGKPINVVGRK
jgi:phosphoglycerate dehydrogenase-like enzyme